MVCEDRARVADQALELALALAQRAEDLAGVADQLLDGALLGVEHAEQPVGVLGERLEVADRGGEVGAAPGAWRSRACCIQVWNAALVLASKVRKISSSWTDGCDLRPGQGAALRELRRRCRRPG